MHNSAGNRTNLLFSGPTKTGKSTGLMLLSHCCNVHLLDLKGVEVGAWVPPTAPVDLVAIDHFLATLNYAEVIEMVVEWCIKNDKPIILAGNPSPDLGLAWKLLPGDKKVFVFESFDEEKLTFMMCSALEACGLDVKLKGAASTVN